MKNARLLQKSIGVTKEYIYDEYSLVLLRMYRGCWFVESGRYNKIGK